MKILQLSASPVAGVPYLLRSLIRRHTAHECLVLTGGPGYKDGRSWSPPDALISDWPRAAALVKWADAIVLHNGGAHPRVHRLFPLMKGKRLIPYYHSEPNRVNRYHEKRGFRAYVIAQGHALLYPGMSVLPNMIDLDDPLMMPAAERPSPVQNPTVGYAPSNRSQNIREHLALMRQLPFSSKGWPVTKPVLDRLAAQGWTVAIYYGIPFEQCMKRRNSECHAIVDEVVTGSYHRSSLEACAHAQVAVNSISGPVLDLVRRISGATDVPFLRSSPENLESDLMALKRDPERLVSLGRESRMWMERNWSPRRLWNDHWEPALQKARMA